MSDFDPVYAVLTFDEGVPVAVDGETLTVPEVIRELNLRAGVFGREPSRSLGAVAVRVADTGIGIAADHLEKIFEPFVQIGAPVASDDGVGLGLWISRDLARAMGGDLTVESAIGRGSTFTLILPSAR